ncbi:MAG: Dabb family protein [Actinobacteria bacterium]|nr:Dabb family protein [Actinomycetota bacterium]
MIRHVSLLTWKPDTSADAVAAVTAALSALPAEIPELVDYRVGPDLGIDPANASFAVIGEFASPADYATYRDHPAHRTAAERHILPILAARTALQYEI